MASERRGRGVGTWSMRRISEIFCSRPSRARSSDATASTGASRSPSRLFPSHASASASASLPAPPPPNSALATAFAGNGASG
eukprot:3932025-Rhodomonas_salina.1